MVPYEGSEEDAANDSISLVASDAEDWSCSLEDPGSLLSREPGDA